MPQLRLVQHMLSGQAPGGCAQHWQCSRMVHHCTSLNHSSSKHWCATEAHRDHGAGSAPGLKVPASHRLLIHFQDPLKFVDRVDCGPRLSHGFRSWCCMQGLSAGSRHARPLGQIPRPRRCSCGRVTQRCSFSQGGAEGVPDLVSWVQCRADAQRASRASRRGVSGFLRDGDG